MNFRLVPKSVTLNDLERRNGPYFACANSNSVASAAHCVKVVEDVVVKRFTLSRFVMSFVLRLRLCV